MLLFPDALPYGFGKAQAMFMFTALVLYILFFGRGLKSCVQLQSRINKIILNLPAGFILFDEHNDVNTINPSANKSLKDIKKCKNFEDFMILLYEMSADLNESLSSVLEKRMSTNNTKEGFWEVIQNENKSYYMVQVSVLLDDIKIVTLTDISDMVFQDNALTQAKKMESLGVLAGGVAHDFNNVMSIVSGYTHLLDHKRKDDAYVQDYVVKIQRAVERGADLTRQLLVFGKKQTERNTLFDLNSALKCFIEEQNSVLDEGFFVHSAVVEEGIFIEGPPGAIPQILTNLVKNSIDAMPQGGTIEISAHSVNEKQNPYSLKKTSKAVCISVKDEGIGIASKDIKRLFDPFFTTKSPDKGTGLGLTMVYGLVDKMNGWIEVQSEVDMGTKIDMFIPMSKNKAIKKRKKKKMETDFKDSKIVLEGKTVLLVDDEPDIREIIKMEFERIGLKVIEACDGNEALAAFDTHQEDIDFVLTDVVMPKLDGIKLAELLYSLSPEVKLAFMSGYPLSENKHSELFKQSKLFSKPLDMESVKSYICKALMEGETLPPQEKNGLL